jgi:probable HAF family extracellular repeat protein
MQFRNVIPEVSGIQELKMATAKMFRMVSIENVGGLGRKGSVVRSFTLLLSMGVLAVWMGVAFAADSSQGGGVPKYQLVEIGTLGGAWTHPAQINAFGQVAGTSNNSEGYSRAFLWDGGQLLDLGTLGGSESWGYAINDAGYVAGRSQTQYPIGICSSGTEGADRAFLWDGTVMRGIEHPRITCFAEDNGSSAVALNAWGQALVVNWDASTSDTFVWDGIDVAHLEQIAVGVAINDERRVAGRYVEEPWEAAEFYRAFVWNSDANDFRELATPPSFLEFEEHYSTGARDINASGNAAGSAVGEGSQSVLMGIFWTEDSVEEIEPLDGQVFSTAYKINDNNQVIGISGGHAFLWESGVTMDLGPGFPSAINNLGYVTGRSPVGAFLWNGESVNDLNQLISPVYVDQLHLEHGIDINDLGQILVQSGPHASRRAYVLTPISLLFSRLLDDSIGAGPGKALESRVANAISFYATEDLQTTCLTLEGFVRQVGTFARQRNAKVTASEAEKLTEDAEAIQVALGCP